MSKVLPSRKHHIQHVATNLFKTKGYKATTMRQMAREVGIEAASIYNHVGSKEEILQQICFGMSEQFFNGIEPLLKENISAEKKLWLAIQNHIEVLSADINAAAVFLNDWRHLSEPHLTSFKKLRTRYENLFRKILREGMDKKVFKRDDETFLVLMIFSSLNWIHNWYNPKGKMKANEIASSLTDLILNGIKK